MAAPLSSFPAQSAALIQGASRGIGFEFVRQLLASRRFTRVYASARAPQQSGELLALVEDYPQALRTLVVDVTREDAVQSAAEKVACDIERLHLLVNVSGVLHDRDGGMWPEKRLEDLSAETLMRSFEVNAVGPALIAKHFHRLLAHDDKAVLASLSARVGSIGDNRFGGWYAYRASKAAQNMLTRTIAIELGRRARNLCCLALHPGTTDTALSAPFQRRVPQGKLFTSAFAVERLLGIIDSVGPEHSGRFYAWDGSEITW